MPRKTESRVRLQPLVEAGVVERIDRIAAGMGWSRNKTVAWILKAATSDLEGMKAQLAMTVEAALGYGPVGLAEDSHGNLVEISEPPPEEVTNEQ
jgi:hypothetical protein